jgi:ribosomal protein S18 acetylase RimI-like enzyme
MAAITSPMPGQIPQLRSLNILRDLPAVADLVEKCFASTMDAEGKRYIEQMRRAGHDNAFLRWASSAVDSASMPLSGYVWEENSEIIGNVSLIPYRHHKRKYYLIANVAVRPEQRRRGIGRALTVAAMDHARQRRADETWLHVRDDNPGAIKLYETLGFHELARRTNWQAKPDPGVNASVPGIQLTKRSRRDWSTQESWLRSIYPELMDWYNPMPWNCLRPGVGPAFYRFMMEYDVRHWAGRTSNTPSAILTWQAGAGKNDRLWAALPPERIENNEKALTALLLYARRNLTWRENLVLDFPAGQYSEAIQAAGFHSHRTLLWMKLQLEDHVDIS